MSYIPLTVLPSALSGGDHVANAPRPGMTLKRPPETPDFEGTPRSLMKLPAPSYIPQEVMRVTTALTVFGLRIRSPVEGLIPLFASIAPNLESDWVLTNTEQFLKYRSSDSSEKDLVS